MTLPHCAIPLFLERLRRYREPPPISGGTGAHNPVLCSFIRDPTLTILSYCLFYSSLLKSLFLLVTEIEEGFVQKCL